MTTMRKILLLYSTLLTLYAHGQASVYRPFPTNYGKWVYQYYDEFHNPTSQYTQYTLNGDTTLAGINYKKTFVYSNYVGALRENNKKIYFVPDTSSNEYVLYNFNLNLGDTIIHPYGGAVCSNDTVIIQQVDSVLLSDGYHRQCHLSSNAIWIEGVGSLFYLLNPCNVFCVSANDLLQCVISDLSFTYPSIIGSCTVSVSELISSSNNISAYPNPANDFINVRIEGIKDFKNYTITIADILGRIVSKEKITQNPIELNNSTLPNGIYLLKINDGSSTLLNKKIIVQH